MRKQIDLAKRHVLSNPAYAARLLATVHRMAGSAMQREIEGLITSLQLGAYVEKRGTCLVPR